MSTSSAPIAADPPAVTTKRKRITKACDFCHHRGRKCKSFPGRSTSRGHSQESQPCLTCVEHGVSCTWTRVSLKRGVSSKSNSVKPTSRSWVYDENRHLSRDVVHALILVFFDTVYPIFPFFDESQFLRDWESCDHSANRPAFSQLMAVCALSACHVSDGAMLSPVPSCLVSPPDPKVYLNEAQDVIQTDITGPETFVYLQTIGTLVLVAIQIGDYFLLHRFLGLYHTLTAQNNFHDESRWPSLQRTEKETHRKFFWSMYRIEVHSSLVMGHAIRCPEMQATVFYPEAPDQTSLSNSGISEIGIETTNCWIIGWNYVTDLYRVLEHVMIRFRMKRMTRNPKDVFYDSRTALSPSIDSLLNNILRKQEFLPDFLARASVPSDNVVNNRCGFQVANIVCTIQLLKTLSFACDEITLTDACTAALQLIDEISMIPTAYLRAIGSPMVLTDWQLQELSGVGHLLSSFIGRPLVAEEFQNLRSVILSMIMLLERLGESFPSASTAGLQLSQHVERIDSYLRGAGNLPVDTSTTLADQPIQPAEADQQLSVTGGIGLAVPLEYLQHIPWPGLVGIDTGHFWINEDEPSD